MTDTTSSRPSTRPASTARVTAVLGPTNTGKTHYAVTRMLGHETGIIGLPLRLLAREIYDRVVEEKGVQHVALMTGEEKIGSADAAYTICTVESMPMDREVDFLAIDEIQLCTDPERGHVFTDRMLHARGTHETLLLGSETMRALLKQLLGDIDYLTRNRFSELKFAGSKKISRLPRRSAVVAFSTDAVYSIAELIRRQRGGAAVVMGALSPRTRNAQVELYQSGEVDFLVATDAIGMGLNMDVDHVAFASRQKFDGRNMRALRPNEAGQIAGRAGRYTTDGTFGTTGDAGEFDADMIEQIESHRFDPVRAAQWRNNDLDFASIDALTASLELNPGTKTLMRTRSATDLVTLGRLSSETDVAAIAADADAVQRLWQICQVPDFRNISPEEHAQLLLSIFRTLNDNGDRLSDDFMEGQIGRLDRTDGDIDALASRIANIRTWTFVSNRAGWLNDATQWQDRTREVENKLSDALHEALTKRFIDRRTSVLMKRLHQDEDLTAEIDNDGEVTIEGEFVGKLDGFRFVPDPRARGLDAKMVARAADKAVRAMMAARAETLLQAPATSFRLSDHGRIWWEGHPIARAEKGADTLSPRLVVISDELLDATYKARIEKHLTEWLGDHVDRILSPLIALRNSATAKIPTPAAEETIEETKPETETPATDDKPATEEATPKHKPNDPRAKPAAPAAVIGGAIPLTGLARGIGFQLVENFGVLDRRKHAGEVRALEQDDRAQLRRFGVRFGEFSLFIPTMLKPSPAILLAILWGVHNERYATTEARPTKPAPTLPAPGLCSVMRDSDLPNEFYSAAGFRVCGQRAVRIDMLERLGGMIRDARSPDAAKISAAKADAKPVSKVEVEVKKHRAKIDPSKTEPAAPAGEETAPGIAIETANKAADEAATSDTPAEEIAAVPAEAPTETPPAEAAKHKIPVGMFEASVDMMSIVGCSGDEFEGILRGLGYKTHTLRGEGLEDLVVWRSAPRHDGPRRKSHNKNNAQGRNQGQNRDGQNKAGQNQGGQNRSSQGKPDGQGYKGKGNGPRKGKGPNKGPHKGKGGKPQNFQSRPPRREKKADPDSPFAVLAALKDDLKS